MNFMRLSILLVLASAGLACFAQKVDTIYVPEKISFAEGVNVRGKVRTECRLEEKTSTFIRTFAQGNAYKTVVTEKPKSGPYHVLEAEIVEANGAGGGAWSGPKSMRVAGKLKDHTGKVIATFSGSRFSTGGVFGGYKGTCSILGRCTKAIGKDIAGWLIDPEPNALLGDG